MIHNLLKKTITLGLIITITSIGLGVFNNSWQNSFYIPSINELKTYGLDCWNILTAVLGDQKHIGAFTASSPWLVHHITKYIPQDKPARILEAGSGAGTVTKKIIERMSNDSTLDAVEYHKDLFKVLENNLGAKQNTRIKFYNSAIEAWNPSYHDKPYDIIISTLPKTQLSLASLEQILAKYMQLLKPGGLFIYITLCGAMTLTLWTKRLRLFTTNLVHRYVTHISQAKRLAIGHDLTNYNKILQLLDNWQQTHFHEIKTEIIPLNITPVYVIALQKKK